MNRASLIWMVGAVAVVGLAAVSVILGTTLLPSRTAAQEANALAPWLLTWGLVLAAALLALALAGVLIVIGVSRSD